MQYIFWNTFLEYPDFIVNQGGPGRVSLFTRSVAIGAAKGIKPLNDDFTLCPEYSNMEWQTQKDNRVRKIQGEIFHPVGSIDRITKVFDGFCHKHYNYHSVEDGCSLCMAEGKSIRCSELFVVIV